MYLSSIIMGPSRRCKLHVQVHKVSHEMCILCKVSDKSFIVKTGPKGVHITGMSEEARAINSFENIRDASTRARGHVASAASLSRIAVHRSRNSLLFATHTVRCTISGRGSVGARR